LSLWGQVDEDLTYDFLPLWSLDEQQQAEVRMVGANTDRIHIDSGIFSPEEVRNKISVDVDSGYNDIDAEDVPDLKQEEMEGLFPQAGSKSSGGGGGGGGSEDDLGLDDEDQPEEREDSNYFGLGPEVDNLIDSLMRKDGESFEEYWQHVLPMIEPSEAEEKIERERPDPWLFAEQKRDKFDVIETMQRGKQLTADLKLNYDEKFRTSAEFAKPTTFAESLAFYENYYGEGGATIAMRRGYYRAVHGVIAQDTAQDALQPIVSAIRQNPDFAEAVAAKLGEESPRKLAEDRRKAAEDQRLANASNVAQPANFAEALRFWTDYVG
jgi:hypothetical protein